MLSQFLSFPIVSMSTSCLIAIISLIMGNDKGLETAGVIGAIGGTSFQAQSSLQLKELKNKLGGLSDEEIDNIQQSIEEAR